ncbi:MAG: hypothetical protein OM95_02375 [Bdellovibrio sp. ArHS]|uniref:ABC transporter ATP-binding protein n=1 Tax=Bdellovibrio sp. ArHS TaxID=1569284 RepID=UPI000582AB92|nr:ABC transporter ATP-binding protein [Bdellovibrio sp. ArHS]KHD89598.1 MAG: hypothetical protein OM95_02375 [Bdellovibrio sp. ArHS]
MIEIRSLSKSYGKKKVLDRLNGKFEEGLIHGILGPNGCGKTTLIKSMLGLVHIDAGDVLLDGVPLKNCREKVSWLPQHPEAPRNTSPQELFTFIEDLRGEKAVFKDLLIREFDFSSELTKPLKALSGGNFQKCFLIATLMFDVPLIILDEPTVGLDPVAAAHFKKILMARAHKTTVLLISHITSEIEQLSDKVHFLLDGQWAYSGLVSDLESQTGVTGFESSIVHVLSKSNEVSHAKI